MTNPRHAIQSAAAALLLEAHPDIVLPLANDLRAKSTKVKQPKLNKAQKKAIKRQRMAQLKGEK